jgi:hypothetical protein
LISKEIVFVSAKVLETIVITSKLQQILITMMWHLSLSNKIISIQFFDAFAVVAVVESALIQSTQMQ